ncbi:hypothetical protein R3W88_032166 [Solanum pinnatisectum]|uniref:Uncharacterized protein n=1 Tax=Solanum pinnatisectum TaxID=50273 RepID=A0AAV9LRU8_9SOLN|nr:hypothetical protein R3W88_032166 [Solanum pinnatisectum]
MYLGIPECTFQAQMHRCLMTLEFALMTGLKCTDNEVDFQSYVNSSKWLLVDYFHGSTNIKKEHLIKCFYDKMWGVTTKMLSRYPYCTSSTISFSHIRMMRLFQQEILRLLTMVHSISFHGER